MQLNRWALAELRERSGYTKAAFARALAISKPHMTDLEAGRRSPSPDLLRRMATELKVPLAALLMDPNGKPEEAA